MSRKVQGRRTGVANGAEPTANEARDRLLGEAGGFLITNGMGMRIAAERARDLQANAAAICTQINGDLTGSQRDLIAHNNYYAAAALGRQVLETTQLLEYFFDNPDRDRKSTRLNSSHSQISYAVFCLKKKKT